MSTDKTAGRADRVDEAQLKPSGIATADLTQGSVQLLDEGGTVRKIPIPTDNPDDPLTWSLWSRCLIFAVICLYGVTGFGTVQSTPLFFSDLIAEYKKQSRGAFNPARIGDLASYPSLCMGVGNFLFVPMSLALGRRSVAILCSALMLVSVVWAGMSTSFNSHLGARCLQGLSAGVADCLLPLIVLDITFLHQRGLWMTLYWTATAVGASLMLVAVPFLVHHEHGDWRVNYWFWLGWAVLSFILIVTCLHETLFYREPALLNGQLIISDAYGQVRFEHAPGEKTTAAFHAEITQPSTAPKKSYLKRLLPIPYKTPHSRPRIFIQAYTDMLICLTHPAIIWTLTLNAILFAGLVILSMTYESLLLVSPWNFSPQSVGTAQLGAALGSTTAFLVTGTLIERTAHYLDRRNNGVREPEHLLPSFFLPVTFGLLGLCIYGVVGAYPQKYSWVGVHASFALYYCSFVAISSLSSIWAAELMPKRAGPAIVLICGGRNAASFGISHAFAPWLAHLGFQNVHISLGGIFVGVALFVIPVFFFGKKVRKIWGGFFP